MIEEKSFWIQQRAPAGNYYDSLGLHKGCTREEAIKELQGTREHWKGYPQHQFRLIERTDTVIPVDSATSP